MRIQDIMTQDVHSVGPADSLQVAAQLMWDHDCGAVPVVGGEGTVIGMVTDRDICMASLTQGRILTEIPVYLAMSHEAFTCYDDDSVEAAESIMREKQVRRLPVIDELGQLVGVLSLNDLARRGRNLWSRSRGLRPSAVAQTLAAVCAPHAVTH